MKKLLTILSFTICSALFSSCLETREDDFFQKKFDTDDIEILAEITCDSAYSPHAEIEFLYRITHSEITDENFDSLFNQYLIIRREFMNPTYNNCIKKTYAIKVKKDEPQIHSIYYVAHRGMVCMHDKEMIMRQLIDIDHNFFYYKNDKRQLNLQLIDTCKLETEF